MVIPLAAAVLVCLLATSGVWLMTAEKDDSERDTTPIGLNVPTQAPGTNATGTDGPTAAGKGMQGEKPNPSSASPTASATGSKTPTPSKSTTKPATSAPPSSTPPPSSSAPPPPPPTTSAPPQPKEYAVSGAAEWRRGSGTRLTITVKNPNATPLGAWVLEIDDDDLIGANVQDPPASVQISEDGTSATSGGLNGGTSVTITFRLYFWQRPSTITYTFAGTSYEVPVTRG
ncbi:hypothetical protein OG216_14570 [Streptomycetaceae bacterium NBC_01309]